MQQVSEVPSEFFTLKTST